MSGEAYAAIYGSLSWHPKVLAIAEPDRVGAYGFYCATVAYCQTYRTDGRVLYAQLPAVFPCPESERKRLTKALITVRLFDEIDDGIEVHDYLDHNRSRVEIETAKENMSKGGKRGGIKSGETRRSQPLKPTLEAPTEKSREEKRREVKSSDEKSSEESCTWCVRDDGTRDPDCPDCGGTGLKPRAEPW